MMPKKFSEKIMLHEYAAVPPDFGSIAMSRALAFVLGREQCRRCPRFRSSHTRVASSDANFGIEGTLATL
jgi:hypothetical protein